MKKLILVALVIAVAVYGYTNYSKSMSKPADTNAESSSLPASSVNKYSLDTVSKHATKDDCWLAIDGKVYDVTPYIKSAFHPGKDAILLGCGKDATEMFKNRPNGSGSHSEKAFGYLSKYEIGALE